MFWQTHRWNELKRWVRWGETQHRLIFLLTSVAFPIFESYIVNQLTGSTDAVTYDILWWILVSLGAVHLALVVLLILQDRNNPLRNVVDVIEFDDRIKHLEAELSRRAEATTMIRSMIESLNLQTCHHNPDEDNAFCQGVSPILEKVICKAHCTLGIASHEFTVEIYCKDGFVFRQNSGNSGAMRQEFFYSSHNVHPCQAMHLGARAPYIWSMARHVPGVCHIASDKHLFYENDKPHADVYFRSFATVPILQACDLQECGVLVITSMQTTPFADNILDTMQFVASLIAQYIASHNRCFNDRESATRTRESTSLTTGTTTRMAPSPKG